MKFSISHIARISTPFRSRLIIASFKPWIAKKQKILDIGCGNGISTKMIMENFKAKIVGCDIENYLDVNLPFRFIPKSGRLPFKDKSFDYALLNDVLHHIEFQSQIKIINEALRVAKNALIFETQPTLLGKISDVSLNILHYNALNTPLSFRTGKDWRNLFKKKGIKSRLKVVKSPFWYPVSHIAMFLKD